MLRAVIVDDEPHAILALRRLIVQRGDVDVVGVAQTLDQAARTIEAERPDVVFLDVQLRGGTGFDLLAALDPQPVVVFVTAHSHYAVKAFSVEAVDYLVKPVLPERLADTLQRVERLLSATAQPAPSARAESSVIELRTPSRTVFADPAEIVAVVAEGDFSRVLISRQPTLLILRSLGHFERTLPSALFQRLDRSTILNARRVRRIAMKDRNLTLVTLDGLDAPLPIGRTASSRLRALLASR